MGERSTEIERQIAEQRQQTSQKIHELRERISADVATVKDDAGKRTQQLMTDTGDALSTASGFLNLRGDNMLLAGLAIGFVTGFMDLSTGLGLGSNGAGRQRLDGASRHSQRLKA